MYEVKMNQRTVLDREIRTWSRDVYNCNILEVEAGTNGPRGGNSSYGCRCYLRIEDVASSNIVCKPLSDGGFELMTGGDTELDTLIEALKFAVNVLEDERRECSQYGNYEV